MSKDKIEDKVIKNANKISLDNQEDLAFIEYQENITKSKEAKRDRLILICLTSAIYLLGLGIFATIVQTIYQIHQIVGIVVACVLFVIYTILYIIMLVQIFSKHSFDLQFRKDEKNHFSERTNNKVRWEIARNIKDQTCVLDYLDKKKNKDYLNKNEVQKVNDFDKVIQLANKYPKSIPGYKSNESQELANSLKNIMAKDGVIYKKAKSIIMKNSIATGCLTALSQNAIVDMSIVAIKNMQMIKDLIWLYGFRPTNYEMNKIMLKVIRNLCISIGLNTFQGTTNILASALKKTTDNFIVQLLSQTLTAGAQFIGNGAMTYLVGKYTINVLLSQYRMQDVFRIKCLEDYELDMDSTTVAEIDLEVKEEVKTLSSNKENVKELKYENKNLLEFNQKKENLFERIKRKRLERKETKKV